MKFMNIAERIGMEKGKKEGEKKGKKEGTMLLILKLLKKRFGTIPEQLENKLKLSGFEMLDKFGESIFDFKNLSDVEKWWDRATA